MTNDGPVHVGFANFLVTGDAGDLAAELYARNDGLHPNMLVYALLNILLRIFSPGVSEGIVQLICLSGPSIAAYFTICQIRRERAWLALLVLPLSLNQAFFLGLYNFCFSTIAFFAAIGSFYWMQKSTSRWRVLAPIAALYLAFICHAGGFIAAVFSLAVLSLVSGTARLMEGQRFLPAVRSQLRNIAIFASLAPLAAVMLLGRSDSPTTYGTPLRERIVDMLSLRLLEIHYGTDAYVGGLLNLIFCVGVAWMIWRLYRSRLGHDGEVKREAAGMIAVAAALAALALVFPDVMGGGWTHFLRMGLFPFLVAPLCLAYLPARPRLDHGLEAIGVLAAVILSFNTVYVQSKVKEELVYLEEINQLIGAHCTIVPIVLQKGPRYFREMRYSPFFHVATRLEMDHDRVSLFNYLARLDVYPVRYQAGRDPQALIYNWTPAQQSTRIQHASVEKFEQATGMSADYVLQWGPVSQAQPTLQEPLAQLLGSGNVVYRSPDGWIQLHKLEPDSRSRCTS